LRNVALVPLWRKRQIINYLDKGFAHGTAIATLAAIINSPMEQIPMNTLIRLALVSAACAAALVFSAGVSAHGDVTPQAVDTKGLPPLGEKWEAENPYRGNAAAIAVGTSGYAQNCARCHGIEAISGGIAPDLRMLDRDCMTQADSKKASCIKENDDYYATTVRKGRVRNGAVYMPPFEGMLQQEAVWAIKAYLETRRTDKP
jgi:cytochrome c-550 PedF